MKFNIIAVSAAILLFQQVFAAPTEQPSDVAVDLDIPSNDMMDNLDMQHVGTEDNALETDLIRNLGWAKQDTQVLTNFLEAIDRLGDMVEQEGLDDTTTNLLSDFRSSARQMMSDAGYEYRELADNRRILSRASTLSGSSSSNGNNGGYHQEMFDELIERLVRGLLDLLNNLRTNAGQTPLNTEVMNRLLGMITSVLQTVGRSIQDALFPRNSPGRSSQ